MKVYKKAWDELKNAKSIMLASHVRPDGDTLGCVLALYIVLKSMGKYVKLYNPSPNMPRHLQILPNIQKIKNSYQGEDFDVVVTCDCGSIDRANLQKGNFTLINIDHHVTNDNFGDINIVNENAPSATMVVYDLLLKNDILISKQIALCLYVGFAEDTGFFSYGNINEQALNMVLGLVKCGLDLSLINSKLKQNVPLSLIRLRQHMYDVFYLLHKALIGVVVIYQQDLRRIGCKLEDTKNIINSIRELATVKMAIMIVQKQYGGYKISLRSKDGVNVSTIAKKFGGGGHKKASGFEMGELEVDEIIRLIVNEFRNQNEK